MKENFYIFIDVDGVLWDWPYIKRLTHLGLREMGGLIENFNPKSIAALNYLIYKLSKVYNVDLVISSTRRDKMRKLLSLLHKEGRNIIKKLIKLPM